MFSLRARARPVCEGLLGTEKFQGTCCSFTWWIKEAWVTEGMSSGHKLGVNFLILRCLALFFFFFFQVVAIFGPPRPELQEAEQKERGPWYFGQNTVGVGMPGETVIPCVSCLS